MSSKTPAIGGSIAWMAKNHVAANLLMIILILGGLVFGSRVKQEVFPELSVDVVTIEVPYPGASPQEVEQGVALAIEDGVRGLEGVKEVRASCFEGLASIQVELLRGSDQGRATQDVKNAVDRIRSFPEDAEKPIVSLQQQRNQVLSLMVYGDQTESTLRDLAEEYKTALQALPEVTLVELSAVRPIEMSIEIPQEILREHNLTLGQVAETVRRTALDIPGGGVRTRGGEILLRTTERRRSSRDFARIPVVTDRRGVVLTLGEIASIEDGFRDTEDEAFYNGKPAAKIDVYRVGDERPQHIADAVREFIAAKNADLPDGVHLAVWNDQSQHFVERIELLTRNAALGLALVMLLLGLFVDPKLAFWVTLGIPISVLGSFLFLPFTGASINMISLFAFIVTLGIIVDDAVIVGENIYEKRQRGMPFQRAAIEGAREISGPIVFAVLTNIVAFMPLFFVSGPEGNLFRQIPSVVVAVFVVSLIESLFVLPAHLARPSRPSLFWKVLGLPNILFSKVLAFVIERCYPPLVGSVIRHRYVSIAIALALLGVTGAYIKSGRIPFSFLPQIDADVATSEIALPFGVPLKKARETQERLVAAAHETMAELGDPDLIRGVFTRIGAPVVEGAHIQRGAGEAGGAHQVGVQVLLAPTKERPQFSGRDFSTLWRQKFGRMTGVESMKFSADTGAGGGGGVEIQLSHSNRRVLEKAATDLSEILSRYKGVESVNDGVNAGKPQLSFEMAPMAEAYGMRSEDLGRQVRHAFFGAEALRQQKGRNEQRVMIRLPREDRRRMSSVEDLMMLTPAGGEIPLGDLATFDRGRAYTNIQRVEGRRVLNVKAELDVDQGNANEIMQEFSGNEVEDFLAKYPGLSYSLEGTQKAQQRNLTELAIGFGLALLVIYALLAIPFRSYFQPLIVMMSIPFGVIGALIGHILLGYNLSMISLFGIIALAGVVVNDSLVLMVTANENRRLGKTATESIALAGGRRFRPILLTSLTTFFGLAPMIFETSVQARFLIPMAISLGFGIIFATFIILLVVPAAYMVLEDLLSLRRWTMGETEEGPEA